jgi:hypothetical protein
LEDALGPVQVTQTVLPEIAQSGSGWQALPHQILCRQRQQNLSTACQGGEPGCPIQLHTHAYPTARLGGVGVESHAHLERTSLAPRLAPECALPVHGGRQAVARGREGSEQVIATCRE